MNKYDRLKEMHRIAKERGGECLTIEAIGCDEKYSFKCGMGHEWNTAFRRIKTMGRWCQDCGQRKMKGIFKSSIEEMKLFAKEYNSLCLSGSYMGAHKKLKWQCEIGHIFWRTPNAIQNSPFCTVCNNKKAHDQKRLPIEKMKEFAKQNGYRCLSNGYGYDASLEWQCGVCEHIWKATYTDINSHGWCPECFKNNKQDINFVRKFVESKGWELLSETFDRDIPIELQCEKNHQWKNSWVNIYNQGNGCPHCSGYVRHTIEDMQELARKRGGECLSKEYGGNAHKKLEWKCGSCEYEWTATPHMIKNRNTWCPCCGGFVSERICRRYFEYIFDKKFPKVRPGWLINNDGYRLELDGFNEDLKIAFEFQGEQHYRMLKIFNNTSEKFEKLKENDKLKKQICKEKGVFLIEILFDMKYNDIQYYIIEQCKKNNIIVDENKEKIDYRDLNIYQSGKIEEMRKIALEKGGECISKGFVKNNEKLQFRCLEGHFFDAYYQNIKNGTWCQKCATIKNGFNKRLDIVDVKHYLKDKNITLLSEEYKGNNKDIEVKCDICKNEWNTKFNYIKSKDRDCPHCAKQKRKQKKQSLDTKSSNELYLF